MTKAKGHSHVMWGQEPKNDGSLQKLKTNKFSSKASRSNTALLASILGVKIINLCCHKSINFVIAVIGN